jgi:microcin C transport system permease protein
MSVAERTMELAPAAPPPPGPRDRFLGFRITPLTRRRLDLFRRNRLAVGSLWVFVAILTVTLFAEFLCNDRPLLVRYDGAFYTPIFKSYPETTFGGFFVAEAEYRDPIVREMIEEKGWILWPPIPFDYRTINYELQGPAPSPPSSVNWLGTDDQARDVLARVVYGIRISVLFGFSVVIISSIIGIIAGATQGYFGGRWDLYFQRFMEIWGSVPTLYVIIILASVITPSFMILLGLFLLWSWMALVGLVRTEFIRARNFDYVRAARALGTSDWVVMFKHILPNAMVSTMTMMPFMLSGSVTLLSTLDFIGYGLPVGSPSLGELTLQARNNLHAPWLGWTAFFTLGGLLMLLVFIGEGVRDAFDPRKNVA